jgi:acetylornithine deacetylase/succinyl-diaminopimelate desuccinylase-like protein
MFSLEELLQILVGIPSVSGFERQLAVFVARFCRQQGHDVWMIGDNVAVRIRGEDNRRAFILNGHLDTVPGDWPGALHMSVLRDRLEGLGVTDMKSGLAVMCMLAQVYRTTPPLCDMWLFFSCEEETTAQGSLDISDWWMGTFSSQYAKKAVLILEPTGGAFVAFGHKGGGVFRTMIIGNGTRHGSTNLAGKPSPLTRACQFGAELLNVQLRWLQCFPSAKYGPATINLTRIHSLSNAPNVIPNLVEVLVDIRTNGAFGADVLSTEFQDFEDKYGVSLKVDDMHGVEVVECKNKLPLFTAFAAGWPELTMAAFPAATDMNAFLRFDLPVAICGPGNESLHQIHENIERGAMERFLAHLFPVVRAFTSLN